MLLYTFIARDHLGIIIVKRHVSGKMRVKDEEILVPGRHPEFLMIEDKVIVSGDKSSEIIDSDSILARIVGINNLWPDKIISRSLKDLLKENLVYDCNLKEMRRE